MSSKRGQRGEKVWATSASMLPIINPQTSAGNNNLPSSSGGTSQGAHIQLSRASGLISENPDNQRGPVEPVAQDVVNGIDEISDAHLTFLDKYEERGRVLREKKENILAKPRVALLAFALTFSGLIVAAGTINYFQNGKWLNGLYVGSVGMGAPLLYIVVVVAALHAVYRSGEEMDSLRKEDVKAHNLSIDTLKAKASNWKKYCKATRDRFEMVGISEDTVQRPRLWPWYLAVSVMGLYGFYVIFIVGWFTGWYIHNQHAPPPSPL